MVRPPGGVTDFTLGTEGVIDLLPLTEKSDCVGDNFPKLLFILLWRYAPCANVRGAHILLEVLAGRRYLSAQPRLAGLWHDLAQLVMAEVGSTARHGLAVDGWS